MASKKVIQFPNSIAKEARIQMKEARLEELEFENTFLHEDKNQLDKQISSNVKEIKNLLQELAVLCGFEDEQEIEFTNEWGDDFEFTPDFDININPEEDK